jgi:hypothetical protein
VFTELVVYSLSTILSDIFTMSEEGIHGANKIPKSIYTLRKDSTDLTLTDKGKAFDIALQMVSEGGGRGREGGVDRRSAANAAGGVTNGKKAGGVNTLGREGGEVNSGDVDSFTRPDTSSIFSSSSSSSSSFGAAGAFSGTGHKLGRAGADTQLHTTTSTSRLLSTTTSSSLSVPFVRAKTTSSVKHHTSSDVDLTHSLPAADDDFWDDVV